MRVPIAIAIAITTNECMCDPASRTPLLTTSPSSCPPTRRAHYHHCKDDAKTRLYGAFGVFGTCCIRRSPLWSLLLLTSLIIIAIVVVILYQVLSSVLIVRGHNIEWASNLTPSALTMDKSISGSSIDPLYFTSKSVVVCGLLRDKESQVAYLHKLALPRLTQHFREWAVVIVENDSLDHTAVQLQQWAQHDPAHVFVLSTNDSDRNVTSSQTLVHNYSEKRIAKMSVLRNRYLDFVSSHEKLSQFDYLIVMDFDLRSFVYADGLWNTAHYFRTRPDIDAIASNGLQLANMLSLFTGLHRMMYQDPYAHEDALNFGKEHSQHWDNIRSSFMNHFIYGDSLYNVRSAFSGLTIYRMPSILAIRYRLERASYEQRHVLCEHVGLHRQLSLMYLNPSLLHVIMDNNDGSFVSSRPNLDLSTEFAESLSVPSAYSMNSVSSLPNARLY